MAAETLLLAVAIKPRAMANRVEMLIRAIKEWPEVAGVKLNPADEASWAAERRAAVALREKLHRLVDGL
jgi:hypothetical protein